ncbi:peptidoglycan editing factor PgeF [Candidatus Saccharibacteria bacterium QS_5_54_17]|nr:MAG: peptidoglycan editing factor PgeF [Candidatus Saccharibacteria bacterium QS_5_54_17]
MKLLTPAIFEPFPEVVAGMSLRDEHQNGNLSMTENGTDAETARNNRERFCRELGFEEDSLAYHPEQKHGKDVHLVHEEFHHRSGDGLVAQQPGWLLGVTVADCVAVLLYDPATGTYGAVHSGWRGSSQNIADAAIAKAVKEFAVDPRGLYAWISPAGGGDSYQVGSEVANQFNPRYSQPVEDDTWLFDNKSVVHDQLINGGLEPSRIEMSQLDTITNQELHSARRDGESSGRMLAAIGVISV